MGNKYRAILARLMFLATALPSIFGALLYGQCPPSSAVLAPLVEDFTSQTVPLIGNATGVNLSSCWTLFSGSSSASFRWETEDATGGNENSSGTGPFFDATSFGVAGGKYLYLETTSGTAGDSAYFVSPSIDVSGLISAELRFAYHMYGAAMGSLAVQVNDGGGWTNVWSVTGQQQTAGNDPWLEAVVDLSTYNSPLTIRYAGVKGSSFTSDMSIDDISIVGPPLSPKPQNLPPPFQAIHPHAFDNSFGAGDIAVRECI